MTDYKREFERENPYTCVATLGGYNIKYVNWLETQLTEARAYKEQVKMVRNFPSHVGDYDESLPEKECGEMNHDGQACYRQGWSDAVDAIGGNLDIMQEIEE